MSSPVPSIPDLLARYPEFTGAVVEDSALLTQALVEAAAETSDWAFPNATTQRSATLMKAAIWLYQSPYARQMRLDDTSAPKSKDLERLLYQKQCSATMGWRTF